jgi:hypothetical protein
MTATDPSKHHVRLVLYFCFLSFVALPTSAAPCTNIIGTVVNQQACLCGTADCSSSKYCDAATSMCSDSAGKWGGAELLTSTCAAKAGYETVTDAATCSLLFEQLTGETQTPNNIDTTYVSLIWVQRYIVSTGHCSDLSPSGFFCNFSIPLFFTFP